MKPFRPDLTAYRVLLETVRAELNRDSVTTLSLIDVAKVLIEKGAKKYAPAVQSWIVIGQVSKSEQSHTQTSAQHSVHLTGGSLRVFK
jgi:hypothetical protein